MVKVYQLSREFYPYANAGGLKEVVTGIAESLSNAGHDSSVFIPCYGFIDKNNFIKKDSFFLIIKDQNILITIYYKLHNGVKLHLIDFPSVSDKKSVYTYTVEDERENPELKRGEGFYDSDDINIIFQLAFIKYITEFLETPDVINLHDGHTGLVPLIIKSNKSYRNRLNGCKIFFTIHNAGLVYHQRLFCKKIRDFRVIDKELLCHGCFNGEVDPICLAVLHSKAITVSPFYADEIVSLKHEESSGGFGLFCNDNGIKIEGITNGVNINHYSKLSFSSLPTIAEKQNVKTNVHKLLGNNDNFEIWGNPLFSVERPLFLFQNRITEQKGIDKFICSIRQVVETGTKSKFMIMGQGEAKYEDNLIKLAKEYPEFICYIQGYDEVVALNLFLSSDFFVLTSIWEPCGLTDFEAQLAGSIPIVHKIGGLKKVINDITGFVFEDFSELKTHVLNCEKLYFDDFERLEIIRKNAYENICNNYTWDMVLQKKYIPLFKK